MLSPIISRVEALWYSKGIADSFLHFDIRPDHFSQYVSDYMNNPNADMTATVADLWKDWVQMHPPVLKDNL